MGNARRAYAHTEAETYRKRQDSTRTDSARAATIARRTARAIKRETVGGAR